MEPLSALGIVGFKVLAEKLGPDHETVGALITTNASDFSNSAELKSQPLVASLSILSFGEAPPLFITVDPFHVKMYVEPSQLSSY